MAKFGEKRERVRIVRNVKTQSADGSYDAAETTVATRWAKVTPDRGNEAQQAGRQRGAMGYSIELDAATDVRADDTIYWETNGSLALNVREVRKPMGRALDMVVYAEMGVII